LVARLRNFDSNATNPGEREYWNKYEILKKSEGAALDKHTLERALNDFALYYKRFHGGLRFFKPDMRKEWIRWYGYRRYYFQELSVVARNRGW